MDYRSLLNERQYEAVSTNSQFVRVVAGAGSGKTRVLTYRISYLISEMNVLPSSIVAIAFTNKVAEEMKARALGLLNGLGFGLSVSTFHSYCAKFLRKEIDIIGFPNNFTIMDDEDTETLIKNIAVDEGFKKNDEIVKYAIGYISYQKCNGKYPEQIIIGSHSSEREKQALKFFHIYEDRKNQMLSLDFDDLLLKTIQILENYPEIRTKWQNHITNLLVDEFQDVNDVQYKLLKLLMKPQTSLYVVGDPDQTIYTWRGANQNIILNFTKDFKDAETIILNQNYRSTKTILDCANKLIAYNKKRVPKDLFTRNEEGDSISVETSFSRELEAKRVIDNIENLVKKNPSIKYKDIVILYRAAYLTLPFENELMRRGIKYRIFGGLKFFQRKEIKDVLAYFRLIYNPKDDISFERIVNVPRRGIGDGTMDILKAEKEIANCSYLEYIENIENYNTEVKAKNVMALTYLNGIIKKTRDKLGEDLEAYPKILEDFIRELGYFDYLASDDENEDRVGNVKTLFENIVDFAKKYPESSFEEYLENATLQTSQDEIADGDYVSLMTIHVAKGLEYNYVFVVSLVDGIFPSQRTMDESGSDGIEEERRLCYVAFTRAKKKLFLSSNTSYSFILQDRSTNSRFFSEAGLTVNTQRNDGFTTIPRAHSIPGSLGYFMDEDNKNPYKEYRENKKTVEEPKTNNVISWSVGDRALHDVFGEGVVTEVIDDAIIEINFESCGKKSIMASHPKIHKIEKEGAAA